MSSTEILWNPTGVWYCEETDLLYIANYNGHDVLICRYEPDNPELALVSRITAEGMVSPENVAVSEDGARVAVADYDGNAIWMFDGQGTLLWKYDLGLVHGVAMDGEYVYATGLLDRCVVKLTLDGELICQKGSIGQSGVDTYLWPTAVSIAGEHLLVTDAHQGRIILLNREDLSYISAIGGNGPSESALNYPYCTIVSGESLYVCDSFNYRILRLDMDGTVRESWQSIEVFETNGAVIFPETSGNGIIQKPDFSIPYTYETISNATADLFGLGGANALVNGYDSIWVFDEAGNSVCQISASSGPACWGTASFFYSTWLAPYSYDGKEYLIFGSPQASYVYVLDQTDHLFFPMNLKPPTRTILGAYFLWYIDGQFYGKADPDQVLQNALDPILSYIDVCYQEIASGKDRRQAYIDSFEDYYRNSLGILEVTGQTMEEWTDSLFATNAGQAFLTGWKNGESPKQLARQYCTQVLADFQAGVSQMYVTEFFAVSMLSEGLPQELELLPQAAEQTYDGYGPDQAADDNLSTYMAALETASEHAFSAALDGGAAEVSSLECHWYDSENCVRDFTVCFYLDGQEVYSAGVVGNAEPVTQVWLDTPVTADAFTLTATGFHGQERLLLKEINLYN